MTTPGEKFPLGARVRLVRDVERYPHFIAPSGSYGTVVTDPVDDTFGVRLDEWTPGASEWDNEVHWYLSNGDDPLDDVEYATEVAVGLRCDECGATSGCARGDASRIVYCGECGREWHPDDDDYPTGPWALVSPPSLRRDGAST